MSGSLKATRKIRAAATKKASSKEDDYESKNRKQVIDVPDGDFGM